MIPRLFGSSKLSFVFNHINIKRSCRTMDLKQAWHGPHSNTALFLLNFNIAQSSMVSKLKVNVTPQNWKTNDSHSLQWYDSKFFGLLTRSGYLEGNRRTGECWGLGRMNYHRARENMRPKKENLNVKYISSKHITNIIHIHTLHSVPQLYISRFSMWYCKLVNPCTGLHTKSQNTNFRPGRPSRAFDETGRVTLVRRRFAVVQNTH